jgi:hypothetical protein
MKKKTNTPVDNNKALVKLLEKLIKE